MGMEANTIPYPLALVDSNNTSINYKRDPPKDERWENFKKAKINLPLIDVIEKTSAHVECVKELSNEKQHNKLPKNLMAHVRVVLSDAIPPKLKTREPPLLQSRLGNSKLKWRS